MKNFHKAIVYKIWTGDYYRARHRSHELVYSGPRVIPSEASPSSGRPSESGEKPPKRHVLSARLGAKRILGAEITLVAPEHRRN